MNEQVDGLRAGPGYTPRVLILRTFTGPYTVHVNDGMVMPAPRLCVTFLTEGWMHGRI